MKAALKFQHELLATHPEVLSLAGVQVHARLLGSLGATGRGHFTDRAIILGLSGYNPATIEDHQIHETLDSVHGQQNLELGGSDGAVGRCSINFDPNEHITLEPFEPTPVHPNTMVLRATNSHGEVLLERTYFSIGGGFIKEETSRKQHENPTQTSEITDKTTAQNSTVPHPFASGDELLHLCEQTGLSIAEAVMQNELTRHSEDDVRAGLLRRWQVMEASITAGCASTQSHLPGKLNVPSRAPGMYQQLLGCDNVEPSEWMSLYALAVNEQNAAGGKVVTAPTNGAAGVLPAVLAYHLRHGAGRELTREQQDDQIVEFLLTAGAIGNIFKTLASISGAEVGCQGEIGSACSMAAAGLAAVLGGTPTQIENAAEIALEHNLGLTCDPIGGLVQIPCIERNAVASHKALAAAHIALRGDGTHFVSLDDALATLKATGEDMQAKYKETSLGGLALHVGVNVVDC